MKKQNKVRSRNKIRQRMSISRQSCDRCRL